MFTLLELEKLFRAKSDESKFLRDAAVGRMDHWPQPVEVGFRGTRRTQFYRPKRGQNALAAGTAVDRLTMWVQRGDIYGFLGPNGAGKSTTLRMLLGLIQPTSSAIKFPVRTSSWEYFTRALASRSNSRDTSFLGKFFGARNFQLLASLSGGVQPKRVEEVLEIVDLRDRARDPVRTYSYGMRQRLGIAQALLPTTGIYYSGGADNGLDSQGIQETRKLIRRLRDEFRLTGLLSSHLLTEVGQLCVIGLELFTKDVWFMKGSQTHW